MEVFNIEQCAFDVALQNSVAKVQALLADGITSVAFFGDWQAAIRQTMHLDPGPGQQLARPIDDHAWAIHTQGIDVLIHCIPGHSGILGNEVANCHAN